MIREAKLSEVMVFRLSFATQKMTPKLDVVKPQSFYYLTDVCVRNSNRVNGVYRILSVVFRWSTEVASLPHPLSSRRELECWASQTLSAAIPRHGLSGMTIFKYSDFINGGSGLQMQVLQETRRKLHGLLQVSFRIHTTSLPAYYFDGSFPSQPRFKGRVHTAHLSMNRVSILAMFLFFN